jgi:hypothetical protein
MAEALYLVARPASVTGLQLIDGVSAAIINKDDGQTDAQIQAACVTAAVAAGIALPAGYFGDATVYKISDLTSGIFKDNLDAMFFMAPGQGVAYRLTSGI